MRTTRSSALAALAALAAEACFYSPTGQPSAADGTTDPTSGTLVAPTGPDAPTGTAATEDSATTLFDESTTGATTTPACPDGAALDPAVYAFDAANALVTPAEGVLQQLALTDHQLDPLPAESQAGFPLSLVDANDGTFSVEPFTDRMDPTSCTLADLDDPYAGAFFGCDGFDITARDSQACAHDGRVVLSVRPEPDEKYVRLASLGCRRAGFVIEGDRQHDDDLPDMWNSPTEYAGSAVRMIGDINGDGLDDILVRNAKELEDPSAVIVFGRADTTTVHLEEVLAGVGGLAIEGEVTTGYNREYADHIGDFNGDGFSDFAIGAPGFAALTGRAYIVFGGPDLKSSPLLQLAGLPATSGGLIIDGEDLDDQFGEVAAAGDVNGDGLQDVLITAKFATDDPLNTPKAGKVYVVFGRAAPGIASIEDLLDNAEALAYTGEATNNAFGYSASGDIDVNGDGLADIVVGATGFAGNTGRTYVIFGQAAGPTPSMAEVAAGNGGFAFTGAMVGHESGSHVHAFEGLTTPWLLIGSQAKGPGSAHALKLRSFLPVSSPTKLNDDLKDMFGFWVRGKDATAGVGSRVSGGGDLDGDGHPDILVAAPGAIANDASDTGQVFVLHSHDFGTPIDLAQTGRIPADRGLSLAGELTGDFAGASIDGRGDVNGDGMSDILVGARNAGVTPDEHEGRAYVGFGGCTSGARVTHLGRPPCDDPDDCDIEVHLASEGADSIVGGARDNDIRGVGTGDVVYAGAGNDTIEVVEDGFTRVTGGHGDDTLVVDGVALDLTLHAPRWIDGIETIELRNGASVVLGHAHVRRLATRVLTIRRELGTQARLGLFAPDVPPFTDAGSMPIDEGEYQLYQLAFGKEPLVVRIQTDIGACALNGSSLECL